MKSIIRLFIAAVALSGWIVAALSIHVVRTPNPSNPAESNLVVVPKNRMGITDTYVDARKWTMDDVSDHAPVIWRIIDVGKVEQLKFLANPHSHDDLLTQLIDKLPPEKDGSSDRAASQPIGKLVLPDNISIAGIN